VRIVCFELTPVFRQRAWSLLSLVPLHCKTELVEHVRNFLGELVVVKNSGLPPVELSMSKQAQFVLIQMLLSRYQLGSCLDAMGLFSVHRGSDTALGRYSSAASYHKGHPFLGLTSRTRPTATE